VLADITAIRPWSLPGVRPRAAGMVADDMPTPCVIYGAKSSPDPKGSIPTQIADCTHAIEGEPGRFLYAAPQQDENASAFKGNRGPGLAEAVRLAIEAAQAHGRAELWVQHSDRLARGSGKRGTARHLGKLYFDLQEEGVELRSVQDDDNLRDAIRAVLIGERNYEDSRRKSAAVADGIKRQAERGKWCGGIVPDGFMKVEEGIEDGNVRYRIEKDPDRRELWELIWSLADKGWSSIAIADEVTRRGYLTAPRRKDCEPRPFDANRIRQALNLRFYAGQVVHNGEVVADADWEGYVTPEEFERMRARRHAHARIECRKPGRSWGTRYLLSGLPVCGKCGARMHGVTSGYVRKDGSRARSYVCPNHSERPSKSKCSQPRLDADQIDGSFMERTDEILGDVAGINAALTAADEGLRQRLEQNVAAADDEINRADRACERTARLMAEARSKGKDAEADAEQAVLLAAQAQRKQAETRRDAALDALSGADTPRGEYWAEARRRLLERRDAAAGDIRSLHIALRDMYESVELTAMPNGSVRVLPVFSAAAAERILEDISAWPHDVSARVVPRSYEAPKIGTAILTVIDPPDGSDLEAVIKRLEQIDIAVDIDGPPAWEVDPRGNPQPPL
jgi:hypothetical protein